MSYRFGDFEIDENSQSLLLGDKIQSVQPRVFDLLYYLVKNAGRVVPKDELLDKLWPGVIVTESSLQRAASLARRTLASGGLGNAIQNFAKRGYRFALDAPDLGTLTPVKSDAGTQLEKARQAALGRKWETASRTFGEIGATIDMEADDLELWALADECRGRPVDAIPALTRAVELHLSNGLPDRAGRAAVTLAKVELERSASARAQGWLERAAAILASVENDAARAYLLWMQSRLATFSGQPERALEIVSRAAEHAERSSDPGTQSANARLQGLLPSLARQYRRRKPTAKPCCGHRSFESCRPDDGQPNLLQHSLVLPHLRRLGACTAVERRLRGMV